MAKREMKMETVGINDLTPNPANPRILTEKAAGRLKKSIERFGFVEPVIAWRKKDGSLEIVAGHQRVTEARAAGLKNIPTIIFPFKSEKEALAYNIASNRLAEMSDWNFPLLKDALAELDDGAFDVEVTGFNLDEIEGLVTWVKPDIDKSIDELKAIEEKFKRENPGGLDQYLVLIFRFEDRDAFDKAKKFYTADGSRDCDPALLLKAMKNGK